MRGDFSGGDAEYPHVALMETNFLRLESASVDEKFLRGDGYYPLLLKITTDKYRVVISKIPYVYL